VHLFSPRPLLWLLRSAEYANFTATACFESHLGTELSFGPEIKDTELPVPLPQTVVPIQGTVEITVDPYRILSGLLLYDSPELTGWRVTRGQFDFGIGRTRVRSALWSSIFQ
jgi:hypothetical protein